MLLFENWSGPDEAMKFNYSWKRAEMLTFCFLLIISIQNSNASDNDWIKNEFGSVHREIRNLNNENTNQNLEISLLKEKMDSQDKTVQQKIIEELNKLLLSPETDGHFLQSPLPQRSKRPVRLLPARLLQGERKNDTDQPPIRRFYGPPCNCSDLALLGYTLNGYYLVKPSTKFNTSNNTDVPIPETIYCTFKQPEGSFNLSAVEKRIGISNLNNVGNNVDLKPLPKGVITDVASEKREIGQSKGNSGPVYFSANRYPLPPGANPGPDQLKPKTSISFPLLKLNLGNAFEQTTGVFTVPKNGVYQFMFTSFFETTLNNEVAGISLYLNDQMTFGRTYPLAATFQYAKENAAMQVILQLNHGDRLYLKYTGGPREFLYATLSFSGSLLHELG